MEWLDGEKRSRKETRKLVRLQQKYLRPMLEEEKRLRLENQQMRELLQAMEAPPILMTKAVGK
jgi:regulator of replication initiation timing